MADDNRYSKWLGEQGWSENPFTLKINPELFVGYDEQLDSLKRHVNEGHKLALVTGSTGSGKTTLMLLLKDMFERECEIIYLGKPPSMDELVNIFTDHFRPSFMQRLRGVNIHVHNLHDYVNKKCKKKLILMVDELHESETEVLEWLRTLNDHIGDMHMIMSGLPTTDEFLRKNLETLRNRVTTRIELTSLSESETREFIKKRIEHVGGKGIEPFTDKMVSEIYRKSGGFPREIIKICNQLLERRIDGKEMSLERIETREKRSEPIVQSETREEESAPEVNQSIGKDFIRDMPSKQRRILKILSQSEDMYPSEIAEEVGIDKYKSKQHAVRSMNNILHRLLNDGYVQRRPRGKGFVYYLEPKVRSILTEA